MKKSKTTAYRTKATLFPIFKHKGKRFLILDTNENDLVSVKNLESGNIRNIEFKKLQEIHKGNVKPTEIPCKSCNKPLEAIDYRNNPDKLLCRECTN